MLYLFLVHLIFDAISFLMKLIDVLMQMCIFVDDLIDLVNKLPKLLVIENRLHFSYTPKVVF